MSEALKDEIRTFNAKEVLAEMKDISGSMLDLAYSAVLYSNREIEKRKRCIRSYTR